MLGGREEALKNVDYTYEDESKALERVKTLNSKRIVCSPL